MRISKSCGGDFHWWSTATVFFNLTRKTEWHLGRCSHSQIYGSATKWRKRWNQTQRKNCNSHTHAPLWLTAFHQQKIKAYRFTLISSFLFHSLLSASLHLESFVPFFFYFSVSPFFDFTSLLPCSHTHFVPPPSVSHSTPLLSVYHSLIQPFLPSGGCKKSDWEQISLFICLRWAAEINASLNHRIEKINHIGCRVTGYS